MSPVAVPRAPVARFQLRRELGRGAQASVWLAHDPLLDREVAIKLLDTREADAEALDGWLDEARAVSRLSHPNIVPVFEADSAAGQPYLVQAVDASLSRLAQLTGAMGLQMPQAARARRPFDEPPAAALAAGAAEGVEAATAVKTVGALNAAPAPTGGPAAALARTLEQCRATPPLRLNELLSLVLEALHTSLALKSVVLCLREPRSGELVGRFALGAARATSFRFVPMAGGDLFAGLTAKGADTLIADAATVASRLPTWYRREVAAPTFLLLQLMRRGLPLGLIYADKGRANSLALAPVELTLVRGLRDALVAAFERGA